jgi:hypothetical protein
MLVLGNCVPMIAPGSDRTPFLNRRSNAARAAMNRGDVRRTGWTEELLRDFVVALPAAFEQNPAQPFKGQELARCHAPSARLTCGSIKSDWFEDEERRQEQWHSIRRAVPCNQPCAG